MFQVGGSAAPVPDDDDPDADYEQVGDIEQPKAYSEQPQKHRGKSIWVTYWYGSAYSTGQQLLLSMLNCSF